VTKSAAQLSARGGARVMKMLRIKGAFCRPAVEVSSTVIDLGKVSSLQCLIPCNTASALRIAFVAR
jgi:hypothetical protein